MSTVLTEDDWEEVFPVRTYTIGKTVLKIKPLGLEQISEVVSAYSVVREVLSQEDISIDNWRSAEVFPKLALVIAQELPQLMSTMSGLDPADTAKLPITIALELATVCIEVNIESGEGLVKNFKALGTKIAQLDKSLPSLMSAD